MTSPSDIIEKQLEYYNNRDLDRFISLFSENVTVYTLPDFETPIMSGIDELSDKYKERFDSSPNLFSHLKSRISVGNFVIDDEDIEGLGGERVRIIAIYEVTDGKISRMWFIRGEEQIGKIDPVEGQLQAYNSGDIETFLTHYTPDCKLYDLQSGELRMEGHEPMRERYGDLFKDSPDLHAKVVERMF
ncbi:MAG: nuclear transport factor 2 family protein, partial [Candidatus Kariarchaeaceae archaeon]